MPELTPQEAVLMSRSSADLRLAASVEVLLGEAEDGSNEKNTLIFCYEDPLDLSCMPEQDKVEEELRPIGEENRSESDVEFHAV
ncbi:hypothetical protein F53441_13665 [Fusarium austroafricanum]|uniref:Uncharacterized protein n=1 Tax=Fusarium austroafricanum TaxID=2364996 RepID=A0A8H4JNQ6_9HYPO|nr:hypothetical protein F53441_13665 [Fusarium austroafricanum]